MQAYQGSMQVNEHIQKLIKQTPLRYNEHMNVDTRRDELQKFAELVIRECAAVVFRNTGPKSALNILEHFDIKEEE